MIVLTLQGNARPAPRLNLCRMVPVKIFRHPTLVPRQPDRQSWRIYWPKVI